jgi:hypothetical protein
MQEVWYGEGKPQSTFCVSVKLLLHSDMHIWVLSFWTPRILRI